MTSKQRSNLKSIAATLKPIAQVGKEGVSGNLLKSLSDALEAHELIKLNLLPASGEDEDALAASIASALSAEVVIVIGRRAVLYRRSSREGFDHIKF
ncbi:MAG TPA: YhbY family RNA-binding protein [Candidatus Gallimonas gallistercoris]|uniref:YhbY family RNA-binding protein n=1 Tax=Candidatus Gallimonas gallistercoris TaxID=2838602 RepID=A0A9D2KFR5_9FIRM|nr:YhbY family RNA-binding protein [Candidatus Gallimonas gallistercoris]